MDAGAAFDEAGIEHQLLVQRDVGLDAFDQHFGQGDAHAADGLVAGVAVGDQLADHRVVVLRHGVAVVHMGVDADAGAAGNVPVADLAGARGELERILGVDAAFDRVAAEFDVLLLVAQLLAGRDADLFLDDVDAGDE